MLVLLKKTIEKFLLYVTSAMLVVMLALAVWQVASRYFLKAPAIYTEETLRFVMVWMGLLGSAYAFGTEEHLKMVFLEERVSPKWKLLLAVINKLVVIFFSMIVLLIGGIKMVNSGMSQISPILNIKMGYVFYCLPLAAIFITILQIINLYLLVTKQEKILIEGQSNVSLD